MNTQKIDLKSELRNLKILILNNEFKFIINEKSLIKEIDNLEFINNALPDDIVSGSIALKLYGLLDRQSNDIDILIKDKTRFSHYIKEIYGEDNDVNAPNRLGYNMIKYKRGFFTKTKEYKVDFFEDLGASYSEVSFTNSYFKKITLKIHNPLEILYIKMSMSVIGGKHYEDLKKIFTNIYHSEPMD